MAEQLWAIGGVLSTLGLAAALAYWALQESRAAQVPPPPPAATIEPDPSDHGRGGAAQTPP